jgi:hypothetical protein
MRERRKKLMNKEVNLYGRNAAYLPKYTSAMPFWSGFTHPQTGFEAK